MGQYFTLANMGSVNSGKSSLIARLLQQIDALKEDESFTELHQLTDSLEHEREKNITFSVGHRFFNIGSTRVHVKDDPGHLELLGNTISGIYQSDLALYVVDGAEPKWDTINQHLKILDFLGIQNILVAVNKCEFCKDKKDFQGRLQKLFTADILFVSAKENQNIDKLAQAIKEKIEKMSFPRAQGLYLKPVAKDMAFLYADRGFIHQDDFQKNHWVDIFSKDEWNIKLCPNTSLDFSPTRGPLLVRAEGVAKTSKVLVPKKQNTKFQKKFSIEFLSWHEFKNENQFILSGGIKHTKVNLKQNQIVSDSPFFLSQQNVLFSHCGKVTGLIKPCE